MIQLPDFVRVFCVAGVAMACAWSAQPADVPSKPPSAKAYKDVDVPQFDKLRADKKNVVLDVRTKEEFAAGHIPGAVNLDYNSADFEKKVSELDKSKTYLVHCAVGGRSARACDRMSKLEFTNCFNLVGGFHAWEKAGKPVEK